MNECSRYMWNDGMNISWRHISQMYYEDADCAFQYFPKLTRDHICLSPYSVMNVRLAAQVMSETVGKVLEAFGPPDAAETAKFLLLMDTFLTAAMGEIL